MLKVAFNGTALLSPLTGIGQYAYHLAHALLRNEPDLDVFFFYARTFDRQVRAGVPPTMGQVRSLARLVPYSYYLRRKLHQLCFDRGVRQHDFDVYHEPNFLAYEFDGPSVVTVHDLSWIRYPETHPVKRVRALERYFEPGLKRARLVLTDSEFVKRELMEVFGTDPARIVAVPLGLDAAFKPMDSSQTAAVLASHDLRHGDYFLSVGTLEPRKNIETTLAAYQQLPEAVRIRHPLVIAGMRGWRTSAMEKVLAPLVASGQVRILGYLERAELAIVTAGALAMVYPSLYEGFGLPPLESMGCGVPTIVSNVSSLPEVVGDTGLSVDPHDVVALSEAMQNMAQDSSLRSALAAKSLARAGGFTWARCASATAECYRRAASSSV